MSPKKGPRSNKKNAGKLRSVLKVKAPKNKPANIKVSIPLQNTESDGIYNPILKGCRPPQFTKHLDNASKVDLANSVARQQLCKEPPVSQKEPLLVLQEEPPPVLQENNIVIINTLKVTARQKKITFCNSSDKAEKKAPPTKAPLTRRILTRKRLADSKAQEDAKRIKLEPDPVLDIEIKTEDNTDSTPDVPDAPNVADIPDVPNVADIPDVPNVADIPDVPNVPEPQEPIAAQAEPELVTQQPKLKKIIKKQAATKKPATTIPPPPAEKTQPAPKKKRGRPSKQQNEQASIEASSMVDPLKNKVTKAQVKTTQNQQETPGLIDSRKSSIGSSSSKSWTRDILSSSSNNTCMGSFGCNDIVRINKKLPVIKLTNIDSEVKKRQNELLLYECKSSDSEITSEPLNDLFCTHPLNLSTSSSRVSTISRRVEESSEFTEESTPECSLDYTNKIHFSNKNATQLISSTLENFDQEIMQWMIEDECSNAVTDMVKFKDKMFKLLDREFGVITHTKHLKELTKPSLDSLCEDSDEIIDIEHAPVKQNSVKENATVKESTTVKKTTVKENTIVKESTVKKDPVKKNRTNTKSPTVKNNSLKESPSSKESGTVKKNSIKENAIVKVSPTVKEKTTVKESATVKENTTVIENATVKPKSVKENAIVKESPTVKKNSVNKNSTVKENTTVKNNSLKESPTGKGSPTVKTSSVKEKTSVYESPTVKKKGTVNESTTIKKISLKENAAVKESTKLKKNSVKESTTVTKNAAVKESTTVKNNTKKVIDNFVIPIRRPSKHLSRTSEGNVADASTAVETENEMADGNTNNYPYYDDDTISLYAESLSAFESSRINTSAGSVVACQPKPPEEYIPQHVKEDYLPKAERKPYFPTKIREDPETMASNITVCEKQNADSTSIYKQSMSTDDSDSYQDINENVDLDTKPDSPDVGKKVLLMDSYFEVMPKTRSTVFGPLCFYNLLNCCRNASNGMCRFRHMIPTAAQITEKLNRLDEKMLIQEYLLLRRWPELRRKYGRCYVEQCDNRRLTRILVEMAYDFIVKANSESQEDRQLWVETIEVTLLHLNTVDLSICEDLLTLPMKPEQPNGTLLCDVFMATMSITQNFSRFKIVFLTLTYFMVNNFRSFNKDVVEHILERVCILGFDEPVARALMLMMRSTKSDIFNSPMVGKFEQQISVNKDIHGEYVMLKSQCALSSLFSSSVVTDALPLKVDTSSQPEIESQSPADSPDTTLDFLNNAAEEPLKPVITRTIGMNPLFLFNRSATTTATGASQVYVKRDASQPYVNHGTSPGSSGTSQPYVNHGVSQAYVKPGTSQAYDNPGSSQALPSPDALQPNVSPGVSQLYVNNTESDTGNDSVSRNIRQWRNRSIYPHIRPPPTVHSLSVRGTSTRGTPTRGLIRPPMRPQMRPPPRIPFNQRLVTFKSPPMFRNRHPGPQY